MFLRALPFFEQTPRPPALAPRGFGNGMKEEEEEQQQQRWWGLVVVVEEEARHRAAVAVGRVQTK